MLLLNFSHPLTPQQVAQIERLSGKTIENIIDLAVQFESQQPFLPQLQALMERIPLTPAEWQNAPILINPPSLNYIAVLLLAELHGRMGYFPPLVRLAPVPGELPPRFEAAEILNLQAVRDQARQARY
ncbi:MAG: hypothetical protein HPY45_13125 [Anaerolineae bacterium]|nr:hypothetical protein [Anaerolineae bacterium]